MARRRPFSLLDKIGQAGGRLFSGPPSPRLDPYQNQMARRLGLIEGGLGITTASGEGATPLVAIARGAMAGRQSAGAERERLIAEQQAMELSGLGADPSMYGSIEGLRQLAAQYMMQGDTETANNLLELVAERESIPDVVVDQDGVERRVLRSINPSTGETLDIGRDPFAPQQLPKDTGLVGSEAGNLIAEGKSSPKNLEYVTRPEGTYIFDGNRQVGFHPSEATRTVDLGGRVSIQDLQGNELANFDKSQTREQQIERFKEFSDTFAGATERYQEPITALAKMREFYNAGTQAAAQGDASPAADLAMVFTFMRSLDPGSVVRESEQRTVFTLGAFADRIEQWFNRAATGGGFTQEIRDNVFETARAAVRGELNTYSNELERLRERGRMSGVTNEQLDAATRSPFNPVAEWLNVPLGDEYQAFRSEEALGGSSIAIPASQAEIEELSPGRFRVDHGIGSMIIEITTNAQGEQQVIVEGDLPDTDTQDYINALPITPPGNN